MCHTRGTTRQAVEGTHIAIGTVHAGADIGCGLKCDINHFGSAIVVSDFHLKLGSQAIVTGAVGFVAALVVIIIAVALEGTNMR